MTTEPGGSGKTSRVKEGLTFAATVATILAGVAAVVGLFKDSPAPVQTVNVGLPSQGERPALPPAPQVPVPSPTPQPQPKTLVETPARPPKAPVDTIPISTRPVQSYQPPVGSSAPPGIQFSERTIDALTPETFCGMSGISAEAWQSNGQFQQRASFTIPGRDRRVVLGPGETFRITDDCGIALNGVTSNSGAARIRVKEVPVQKPSAPDERFAKEQK